MDGQRSQYARSTPNLDGSHQALHRPDRAGADGPVRFALSDVRGRHQPWAGAVDRPVALSLDRDHLDPVPAAVSSVFPDPGGCHAAAFAPAGAGVSAGDAGVSGADDSFAGAAHFGGGGHRQSVLLRLADGFVDRDRVPGAAEPGPVGGFQSVGALAVCAVLLVHLSAVVPGHFVHRRHAHGAELPGAVLPGQPSVLALEGLVGVVDLQSHFVHHSVQLASLVHFVLLDGRV